MVRRNPAGHFYPIYRGTTTAIESLETAGGEGWGAIALLPAIGVFSFFLERFAVAENRHSRTRELLADKAGAEATSNRAMASALVKVHAFAGIWAGVQQASVEALREGKLYTNASAVFAESVANSANQAALEGIAGTRTGHPTDSHPPLAVRLASLKIDLPSVATESLNVRLVKSATSLIQNAEAQEEDLSETYQLMLARRLGIEPGAQEQKGEPNVGIRRCAACQTRVLPTGDGHCPSCGVLMESAPSPN